MHSFSLAKRPYGLAPSAGRSLEASKSSTALRGDGRAALAPGRWRGCSGGCLLVVFHLAMGQNPNRTSEHPNPTTKVGSRTPKWYHCSDRPFVF